MSALPVDTTSDVVAGNDRALDVIDALVTRTGEGPWGVRGELADHVGASRITANRVLQGLTARGLGHGHRWRRLHLWCCGCGFCRTARYQTHPALGGARNIIGRLGGAPDATVMVALQSAQRAMAFIAQGKHQRPGPIRYHLIPGISLPLHAGAAGLVISPPWASTPWTATASSTVQSGNDHRLATPAAELDKAGQ